MKRIAALVAKELNELRRSPSIFLPAAVTGAAAILYPFVIVIIVPYFAGERLADSSDFRLATEVFRSQPEHVPGPLSSAGAATGVPRHGGSLQQLPAVPWPVDG